jgi:hypothetical protein
LQDFEEEVWAPSGGLASGFDASLRFIGAHKANGEATQGRHVLGAIADAVTDQVVLELDIEQPMHAFDAPMAADAGGEALDIARRRRDEIPRLEAAPVRIFDAGVNLDQRLDVGKSRHAGMISIRPDPGDVAGSRVGARLDAAVALFDGRFLGQLGVRRGVKIQSRIDCQDWLIALQPQPIIGAVLDDFVGDVDLASDGVDGDQCAFVLSSFGELIQQVRNNGESRWSGTDNCASVSLALVA